MVSDFTWYFLSFRGRVSRQEFWLGYVGIVVIMVLLRRPLENIMLAIFRPASRPWFRDEFDTAITLANVVAVLILLWPLTAIYGKRMHDINLSAGWLLALPLISALTMVANLGGQHSIGSIGWIVVAIIGLFPGTRGNNRFGADPLAHS
jgi:uncharacterized membrane protein YhaH (DUF805 family)